jgi:hypothetical protein
MKIRTFLMLLTALVLSMSLVTAQTEKKAKKSTAKATASCCTKGANAKECSDKSGKECKMDKAKCDKMKASDKMDCCKDKADKKADKKADEKKSSESGDKDTK